MYEYFGVGSQIREEVDDIYPRFLRWLPKHRLPMPSRHSLEIWRMVIDNLTIDDVSLSACVCVCVCVCVWGFWCLNMVWSFSHSGSFCDFSNDFKSLGWM